jgi:protein TonB
MNHYFTLLPAILLLSMTCAAQEPNQPATVNHTKKATENFELAEPVEEIPHDSNYIYPKPEMFAEFIGGRTEMFRYIGANIEYPPNAVKQKLEGKCYLKFVVEKDGAITDVQIARGVPDCPECDAEALRAVSQMPKWKPGEVEGKPVRSYFYLPISFHL